MKKKPVIFIFVTILVGSLLIMGLIGLYRYMTRSAPVLTAYLSQHELNIPSDSSLLPDVLTRKLSRDSIGAWINVDRVGKRSADAILDDVAQYLETYVIRDLPDDPLFRYTNYYRLAIENEGQRTFRKVFVKFPDVRSVEVRRRGLSGQMLVPVDDKYFLGDVGPGEKLAVYGWNDRPFYVQEEIGVLVGHEDGLSEVLYYNVLEPVKTWWNQNLFMMVIFIVLIFLLVHRMLLIISSCIKSLDPKLEDKTII
jgi:hypothetical protein